MRPSGVGHLAHQIALAIAPRTGRDRMWGVARGPHAKPIVVFADQHNHLTVEILHGAQPLIGVQIRRIEKRRFFPTAAPLDLVECAHAKVEEESSLQPHPVRLIGARQDLRRLFRDYSH